MKNPSASDPVLGSAAFAPLAGVRIVDFSTNKRIDGLHPLKIKDSFSIKKKKKKKKN